VKVYLFTKNNEMSLGWKGGRHVGKKGKEPMGFARKMAKLRTVGA